MNIALKLKKEQLDTLIELLQEQLIMKPEKIADKCMFYLYTSVYKKLLKKQIDKADEFSSKPFKVTLKYEEATSLLLELQKIQLPINIYQANVLLQTKNILHQKLK